MKRYPRSLVVRSGNGSFLSAARRISESVRNGLEWKRPREDEEETRQRRLASEVVLRCFHRYRRQREGYAAGRGTRLFAEPPAGFPHEILGTQGQVAIEEHYLLGTVGWFSQSQRDAIPEPRMFDAISRGFYCPLHPERRFFGATDCAATARRDSQATRKRLPRLWMKKSERLAGDSSDSVHSGRQMADSSESGFICITPTGYAGPV